ncbi:MULTISPECIES: transposase [Hyphomicrobiales]|uniref:IS66-like element accessory protein TnpA n=1 Tax=Hyphomicrobiales TaxID=356 RepID=UPI001E3956E0|nr:transposase [Aurantimonas coralicida]MCD1645502.1 transposase [Aurantimonas coralicida]
MTIAKFEVITGGGGSRRRWSREEKERLVAASFEPGVTASQVARSAGLHTSQLFRWRKQLCETRRPQPPALVPVTVAIPTPTCAPFHDIPARAKTRRRRASDRIEIELSGGRTIRVDAGIDVEALGRILDVVDRRR